MFTEPIIYFTLVSYICSHLNFRNVRLVIMWKVLAPGVYTNQYKSLRQQLSDLELLVWYEYSSQIFLKGFEWFKSIFINYVWGQLHILILFISPVTKNIFQRVHSINRRWIFQTHFVRIPRFLVNLLGTNWICNIWVRRLVLFRVDFVTVS